MPISSRPGRWRPRYLQYGPITDAHPADKREIAWLIQRGRAVTDERLMAQALAYARFRVRVCGVFGLYFLVLAAGDAVLVALGLVSDWIVPAFTGAAFLLSGIAWLWQAGRCRRGARAMAQGARLGAA